MHPDSAEAVRIFVINQFRSLSESDIGQRSSTLIARVLKQIPDDWRGKKVALYRSLKREIQVRDLEAHLINTGAKLCYPRISQGKSQTEMHFVQVNDPGSPEIWEPGPYGGIEPTSNFATVPIHELDVIVVPGLAFGQSGERVGRGKGYYDRALANNSTALRLALGFDFQLFPELQQSSWDQRVDWIVTESEQIRLESRK